MKTFHDLPKEEKIKSLDRMMNVLSHQDWQEVYLWLSDAANIYKEEMMTAKDWDSYLASRAVYEYLTSSLIPLPDNIRHLKESIEEEELSSYED